MRWMSSWSAPMVLCMALNSLRRSSIRLLRWDSFLSRAPTTSTQRIQPRSNRLLEAIEGGQHLRHRPFEVVERGEQVAHRLGLVTDPGELRAQRVQPVTERLLEVVQRGKEVGDRRGLLAHLDDLRGHRSEALDRLDDRVERVEHTLGQAQGDTVSRAIADAPPAYSRAAAGSKLDPFKEEIHRLLRSDPKLPGGRPATARCDRPVQRWAASPNLTARASTRSAWPRSCPVRRRAGARELIAYVNAVLWRLDAPLRDDVAVVALSRPANG